MGELPDLSWDLQSLHEDSLLSLKEDVLWPSDKPGKISSWKDVTTNSEGLGVGLEHSVQLLLWSILSRVVTSVSSPRLYKNITKEIKMDVPF